MQTTSDVMIERMSSTQVVVLQTLNDSVKADWSFGELRREIPGVRFNHATLRHLADDLGLISRPSRDNEGWQINETGKLILAEMHMNGDSRLSKTDGARPFSWEIAKR